MQESGFISSSLLTVWVLMPLHNGNYAGAKNSWFSRLAYEVCRATLETASRWKSLSTYGAKTPREMLTKISSKDHPLFGVHNVVQKVFPLKVYSSMDWIGSRSGGLAG